MQVFHYTHTCINDCKAFESFILSVKLSHSKRVQPVSGIDAEWVRVNANAL